MPHRTDAWQRLATEQHGVVARHQLLSLGLTGSRARRDLVTGRWRTLFPGVYATSAGTVSELGAVWAALLYAGAGAAVSHGTALWIDGILDEHPRVIHVSIPAYRRVARTSGVRIHRSRTLPHRVHPALSPTRTRVEHSVLDHLETADADTAIDVLIRATQRRLTTAARLRDALALRTRHPLRCLVTEVLAEVDHGVQSPLERRYLLDVERPHGLPRGERNEADRSGLAVRYHDVRYRRWSTVVELDGRAAHPVDAPLRDLRRDNGLVTAGDAVLRYGWRDVVGRPCDVAAQVAAVLRSRGWSRMPSSCGTACTLTAAA